MPQPAAETFRATYSEAFSAEAKSLFAEYQQAHAQFESQRQLSPEQGERVLMMLSKTDTNALGPDQQAALELAQSLYVADNGLLFEKAGPGLNKLQRRVIFDPSDVFDAIATLHLEQGHPGLATMLRHAKARYVGVAIKEIRWIFRHCLVCHPPSPSVHQPTVAAPTEGNSKSDEDAAVPSLSTTPPWAAAASDDTTHGGPATPTWEAAMSGPEAVNVSTTPPWEATPADPTFQSGSVTPKWAEATHCPDNVNAPSTPTWAAATTSRPGGTSSGAHPAASAQTILVGILSIFVPSIAECHDVMVVNAEGSRRIVLSNLPRFSHDSIALGIANWAVTMGWPQQVRFEESILGDRVLRIIEERYGVYCELGAPLPLQQTTGFKDVVREMFAAYFQLHRLRWPDWESALQTVNTELNLTGQSRRAIEEPEDQVSSDAED
jgi:hypothetical protein